MSGDSRCSPILSIGIPTWNRCRSLSRILTSITSQVGSEGLSHSIEVVVCDNASDDETSMVVERIRDTSPVAIRYSRNEANIGAVRNALKTLTLSEGLWWMFYGDDEVVPQGALKLMTDSLCDSHAAPFVEFMRGSDDRAVGRGVARERFLTMEELARDRFYHVGNAGGFAIRRDAAAAALARSGGADAMRTCWPQTQLAFMAMAASGLERPARLVSIVSCESPSHSENTVYTTFHLTETGYFALYRAAEAIRAECGEEVFRAAVGHIFSGRRLAEYLKLIVFTSVYADRPEDRRESRRRSSRALLSSTSRARPALGVIWVVVHTPRTMLRALLWIHLALRWGIRAQRVDEQWQREYGRKSSAGEGAGGPGKPRAHSPLDLD